jgi:hypothetical protein
MSFRQAWYVFALVALVIIVFELFFRYRYVQAGEHVWRIDRLTERACVVRVGEAICSMPAARPAGPAPAPTTALISPTPEPNIP